MGVYQMLQKRLQAHTCVYWANPVNDGYGGQTFDDPVELQCHWQEVRTLMRDKFGKEIVSEAVVYLLQDVDEDGYLLLGSIDDVLQSDSTFTDPKELSGARKIIKFAKTPSLHRTGDYVRKAFL